MKALNYNIDFNIIDEKKISFKILSKTKINIIGDELLRRGILKDALEAYKKADNQTMIRFFEENFKEKQIEKKDYI